MKRILKKIAKKLSEIEDVKAVILYGSFAAETNIHRVLILTCSYLLPGAKRRI